MAKDVTVYCCDSCGWETEDVNKLPFVEDAEAYLCDECEEAREWENDPEEDEVPDWQLKEWEQENRQQENDYWRSVL